MTAQLPVKNYKIAPLECQTSQLVMRRSATQCEARDCASYRTVERASIDSSPKKRSIFGHDPAVFDQQTTPGDHAAVVEEIVADDGECRLVAALSRSGN